MVHRRKVLLLKAWPSNSCLGLVLFVGCLFLGKQAKGLLGQTVGTQFSQADAEKAFADGKSC